MIQIQNPVEIINMLPESQSEELSPKLQVLMKKNDKFSKPNLQEFNLHLLIYCFLEDFRIRIE